MSETIDINEQEYELYIQDCRANEIRPSVRDFMVWRAEQDIDGGDDEVA